MSGSSVADAAVTVLAEAPAEGYTVEEIVTILRQQRGFAPGKAYYDVVYEGLMSRLRAGKVDRERCLGRDARGRNVPVWLWHVSDSQAEVTSS